MLRQLGTVSSDGYSTSTGRSRAPRSAVALLLATLLMASSAAAAAPWTHYHVTVDQAHWYETPPFDESFTAVVGHDVVIFGALELPIAYRTETSVIATSPDATIVIEGHEWSFNGIAGQASGTIHPLDFP